MATIELTEGKMTIVDDADFDWLAQLEWHYHGGYAVTGKNSVEMSHLILQVGQDVQALHRNSDMLDNRRENLLPGTARQKCQHKHKTKIPKSSRFKGVARQKDCKRWRAYIKVNGTPKHLGLFRDETDAAHAYDDAAREHFGEFARLNFPGGKRA